MKTLKANALVVLVLASMAISGCIGSLPENQNEASADTSPSTDPLDESKDQSNDSNEEAEPTDPKSDRETNHSEQSDSEKDSTQEERQEQKPWPSYEDAVVRPGMKIPRCTGNFIFSSPDNSTLYIGTAAHCVTDYEENDPIELADGAAKGTLAYSGYWYNETGARDFALIKIDEEDRDKVHPAMTHFGGPTALYHDVPEYGELDVLQGDRVLWYGNSGSRPSENVNANEGYLCYESHFSFTFAASIGVPGDSGSPVMLASGEALGSFKAILVWPFCGTHGISGPWLKPNVEMALQEHGLEIELVTWPLLEQGLLPDLPV